MLDLDFTLRQGSFTLTVQARLAKSVTAVIGPSGSGKTTLLRILAGLARPHGLVRFGTETWADPGVWVPPRRRRVGYVSQEGGLFPHLTVLENVEYGAREPVQEILRLLEIDSLADRRPSEISGGQARRVALGRAIASGPRLLLLDEPLVGLELPLRERILDWLVRLRGRLGIPVLYVTHSLNQVLDLADEVLILDHGRVVAEGGPESTLPKAPAALRYDNRLVLPVRDGRAWIGPAPLSVPERLEGSQVEVVVGADDVILAVEPPRGLSARNVFQGTVRRCLEFGSWVLVQTDVADGLSAAVTPEAARDLALAPGRSVHAILKATCIRVIR